MRRRAFTILELTLTILIFGLIMMFVMPDLNADWKRRSLVESADRLRALIAMAHAKAMEDGRKYRIMFPGAPDPNDKYAKDEVDIPDQTLQPEVEWQPDPMVNPEWFDRNWSDWAVDTFLQPGTRCVAVFPGRPNFDISPQSDIAGPSVTEGWAPFHRVTFNPDGTADWATFVLTDLPYDAEPTAADVGRIINVIVDGRTGQAWLQRALRKDEVEVMNEHRASPILHQDFTRPDRITEENILEVHYNAGQAKRGSGRSGS